MVQIHHFRAFEKALFTDEKVPAGEKSKVRNFAE